ncbi:aminomethyl-transferring glycine dehydrogenase subunit GcvPA [Clostridium sp. D33t1_170424_F3]|uniref:aminomethyl-transferring glycine dehydrogenase subunit GcvPA n=1 Tax=Clostridium sp. D33t1_170424_F3 TaxID=2787099 RepID=UPI0018AA2E80|nr:aminomethyl-transferring glycine dehydrogenase subunit GcvPA [Clostridium sp. D33t1_170424_F3]
MGSYIPSTAAQRQEMLRTVGVSSLEDLYADVPASIRLPDLQLEKGRSELEVSAAIQKLAEKNHVFGSVFRGAGAYDHYIPAIVRRVTSKEEFLTAYTPYQAEISQGILQSIFEYQTMICELTGMDASNASVYDGACAAAEAAAMCRDRKRSRVLISASAHPMVVQTILTYCKGADAEAVLVPAKDGATDLEALRELLRNTDACFYMQQPNFNGLIEDAEALGELVHAAGAKFIMGVNPIAAAVLRTPRECGADIAVGEGQPLGMPLSFGGPYLGFMACTKELFRKLPGRIVGETADAAGRRCYVLTLQAREQHIRREKASSNICSNEALCAMTASVYMAAMGPAGVQKAAALCYSKAHYLAEQICAISGFSLAYDAEFFHEFITKTSIPAEQLLAVLEKNDILGGLPVENDILWCATEKNTKEQMDRLVALLKEAASV